MRVLVRVLVRVLMQVLGRVARPILLPILMLAAAGPAARAASLNDEFDRERFKDGFQHEIAFREAAIHVAWGAEPLCDDTSEIEPFVLWSTRSLRRRLSAQQEKLFLQATGMDQHWRVAWVDEAAPDELKVGTRVIAVNKRPLPEPGTRFEMTALLRGGSTLSVDDQAFWTVMHKAREEANDGQRMTLTLEGGREVQVSTQTGCAGSVMATAFDDEPGNFLRQDGRRTKLPGNALMAANHRDEFRWLAAFGTFFLASEGSIRRERKAESAGQAYMVGKVLTLAVPGAGTLLSAIEAQTQRALQVDSLVGGADLFANEVVMAMGGDPGAGLRLVNRLQAVGAPIDVLQPDAFRRSNIALQLEQLRAIDTARRKAEAAAEAAEAAGGAGRKP